MQAGIDSLIILNVHRDRLSLQFSPIFAPESLRPYDIVRLPSRHSLRELTVMIGQAFPACSLLAMAADFYFHAVQGPIIRSPGRTKNQCIWLGVFLRLGFGTRWNSSKTEDTRGDYEE